VYKRNKENNKCSLAMMSHKVGSSSPQPKLNVNTVKLSQLKTNHDYKFF